MQASSWGALLLAGAWLAPWSPAWGACELSTVLTANITQGDLANVPNVSPAPAVNVLLVAGPGKIRLSATAVSSTNAVAGGVLLKVPAVALLAADANFNAVMANPGTSFAGCTIPLLGSSGCLNTATLSAGVASTAVEVDVTVGSAVEAGTTVNVSSTVEAAGACAPDPVPGNNSSATSTKTVANVHDLAIDLQTATPVEPEDQIVSYNILAQNGGVFSQRGGGATATSNAQDVQVTQFLSVVELASLVSIVPGPDFSCSPAPGPLPFAGANSPGKVICDYTKAGGLQAGSGTVLVAALTAKTRNAASGPSIASNAGIAIVSGSPGTRFDPIGANNSDAVSIDRTLLFKDGFE